MKIGLFGGSGKSGAFVLQELLKRGYTARVLVRHPNSLLHYSSQTAIEIVQGDAEDLEAVIKVLEGTEAVISLLGHKQSSRRMQEKALTNIVRVMKKLQLSRLVCLTGAGVKADGDAPKFVDRFTTKLLKQFFPDRINDGIAMCEIIQQSALDWTIVRTNLQLSRINLRKYHVGLVGDPQLTWHVSRNQIAHFILDCLENRSYLKQLPVISD